MTYLNCFLHKQSFSKTVTPAVFSLTFLAVLAPGCGRIETEPEQKSFSELLGATSSQGCSNEVSWKTADVSGLNEVMYNQSAANLGRGVGNGECADLPNQILQNNSGRNFWELGPSGLDADYVWGSAVTTITPGSRSLSAVLPGDVLQYRNVATRHRVTSSNGSWREFTTQAAHHTSVIKSVSTDGRALCVYEQNVSGKRFVQTSTLWIDGLESGKIWVYRPLAQ